MKPLATGATSDASFINVSIKNSPRLVPHQPQLLKSRNEEELWGPSSPCPPAVEVLKEHLRSIHLRDFPYLRLQTPSKGLALLLFFVCPGGCSPSSASTSASWIRLSTITSTWTWFWPTNTTGGTKVASGSSVGKQRETCQVKCFHVCSHAKFNP